MINDKVLFNPINDISIKEVVEKDLLSAKFNLIKFGVPSHIIFAVLIFILAPQEYNYNKLYLWISVLLSIDVGGLILFYFYKNKTETVSTKIWTELFNSSLYVVSCYWGMAAYLLMPDESQSLTYFLILLIIMLSAVFALQGTVVENKTARISLFFLLFPLIVFCFLQHQLIYYYLSILLFVYLLFTFFVTNKASKLLRESLFFRYKNSILNEQLETSNVILEQEVINQTEQLKAAKDQAESANRAKTEFLGMISHELKCPLGSIKAAVNDIKEPFSALLYNYQQALDNQLTVPYIAPHQLLRLPLLVDGIINETEASSDFIDMLLINLERGDNLNDKSTSECSIRHCINVALKRYPFLEDERELIFWDNTNDFQFYGNETLVIHILFNLLKNALQCIKEEQKGFIEIKIEQGTYYNKLYFKDTAKGVPVEILPRIFERYYTNSNGGTGLGLAFCKMIMNGLKGEISCQSEYKQYTEFLLEFPVCHS